MKRCRDCEEVDTPQGGRCAGCRSEYQRQYRQRHKQENPDYFKLYYRKNRELRRAEARDYWRERPEANQRRVQEWRRLYPERERASTAKYRAANPSMVKRWTTWANWRRRSAPPDAEALDYVALLRADPCAYCGQPTTEIDHIDPLAADGTNDWNNLTPSCQSCNRRKGVKPLLRFLLSA